MTQNTHDALKECNLFKRSNFWVALLYVNMHVGTPSLTVCHMVTLWRKEYK